MDESAPCTIMAQFGTLADLSVERAKRRALLMLRSPMRVQIV